MLSLYKRAKLLLSLKRFGRSEAPVDLGRIIPVMPIQEQFILRMMVKRPEEGMKVPMELWWILPILTKCISAQNENNIPVEYIYITVRHGLVKTTTDDDWHVDGFSLRTPHVPEQNYIWSDHTATEWLDQDLTVPDNFNGLKHNLHKFIQTVARDENVRQLEAGNLYCIDPYIAHRRPAGTQGQWRTFFRISFVPIEIEDDTCTQNPHLPSGPYNRSDIRDVLLDYHKE